jgi:hypothetical protein
MLLHIHAVWRESIGGETACRCGCRAGVCAWDLGENACGMQVQARLHAQTWGVWMVQSHVSHGCSHLLTCADVWLSPLRRCWMRSRRTCSARSGMCDC